MATMGTLLMVSLVVTGSLVLGEVVLTPISEDVRRATELLTCGALREKFWGLFMAVGILLPVIFLVWARSPGTGVLVPVPPVRGAGAHRAVGVRAPVGRGRAGRAAQFEREATVMKNGTATAEPRRRQPGAASGWTPELPARERWSDWTEYDAAAWPRRVERRYDLIPTICFNCEAGCGLLAYVDKETGKIRKFEGNPEHPGSRGRTAPRDPPPSTR